jgi:hypothetical protein
MDYTQDFRGFLLARTNFKEQYGKLQERLGGHYRNYKNLATSFQFVFDNETGIKDHRVNIYNKWVNLLECESIAKSTGMGTKALFFCSSTMYAKHRECMKDGMTRIEVSKEIYSAEEEVAFLES